MSEKKRIAWIDQLRGIAFYFVVLGHMIVPENLEAWIYSFHMPLFFVVSGFTLNLEKMQKTSVRNYLSHLATRMLVPYLWLQLAALGLKYLIYEGHINVFRYMQGIFTGNSFIASSPSNPLYFVLLLFTAQVIMFAFAKLSKGNREVMFALILALTAIPVLTAGKPAVWHLNVVPTAMLFMFIGRFFMDCCIAGSKQLDRIKLPVRVVVCVILFVVGGALGIGNGRASIHSNGFGDEYIIFVISASLTSLAFMLLVMLLPVTKLFSFIGMNTIFLLGIHEPLMLFTNKLFPVAWEKWWFVAIASVICYLIPIPVVWCLNKAAPYICAKEIRSSNLLIKISKFVAVAVVSVVPYMAFTKIAFGGALSSGGGMTVVAAVIFIAIVVGIERLFTLLLPFFFLEGKKQKKTAQPKKHDVEQNEEIMVVVPVEEI